MSWIFPPDPRWLYFTTPDNQARFILGKVLNGGTSPAPAWGFTKKTLICFGINPSTAAPNDPDNTIDRLEGFAKTLGYDSWIMLNIYPQRATNPGTLATIMNPLYHAVNFHVVQTVLNEVQGDLLAAWGDSIEKPSYLRECCLKDIATLAVPAGNSQWHSFGVTRKGNPRQIVRLPGTSQPLPFNMAAYLAGQGFGPLSYSGIIYADDRRTSGGGLTVYVSAQNLLIPYDTDGYSIESILRNTNLFNEYNAGIGNCVYIYRKVCLQVLDSGSFLYQTNNNVYNLRFPLNFSVQDCLNKLKNDPKLSNDPFYKKVKENFC